MTPQAVVHESSGQSPSGKAPPPRSSPGKYAFEEKYDFEESVGYWLTMATQSLHRQFNDELAPHGVTFRQSQVLGWLALEGELSQAELASRMMIEPPTLAGILDRMERAAWITRECCADDRRRKMIRIRPQAEPVWKQIAACARRVRARATAGLRPDEVETLMRLLRVVQHNLDTHCPATAADRIPVESGE